MSNQSASDVYPVKVHPTFILSSGDRKDDRIKSTSDLVMELMINNPQITVPEIMNRLGKSESTIMRAIAELKKQGQVKRIGSRKEGYWETVG